MAFCFSRRFIMIFMATLTLRLWHSNTPSGAQVSGCAYAGQKPELWKERWWGREGREGRACHQMLLHAVVCLNTENRF